MISGSRGTGISGKILNPICKWLRCCERFRVQGLKPFSLRDYRVGLGFAVWACREDAGMAELPEMRKFKD